MKLSGSDLKILDILWQNGDTTAKRIAEILKEQTGWSKTTTYTVIKKCIDKGAVSRLGFNFTCHALVTREQVQKKHTTELINTLYGGMSDQLVAAVLDSKKLSPDEIKSLKNLIKKLS
jgi:predicted transcriptional regulator